MVLQPKIKTARRPNPMKQSNNEKPVAEPREIPDPKKGIKGRGLEIGHMGRPAGQVGIPKGYPSVPEGFHVEPLLGENIFQGVHGGGKMAPKPDDPVKG